MIKVIYNKTCGRCVQSEPLTSGMVGQPIEFEYSSDFDGLTLTAVFTNGKTTVDVLNPSNQCVIPHEVLDTPGTTVSVGIYATRGNELVIPTVYATIGVVLKGADPSGDVSADPTLPVWAQIQGTIGNLNALETQAKDNLVAAINEAAQSSGGGGSTVELDATLSEAGKAADAKAVGDALAGKQDTISDLEAIRTGAAKGATALQSVPNTYRTASEQDTIDSGKVDKVTGKGLSSNDYTDAAKAKVDALAPVATSGSYNDLTNKPTIPTVLPNPNALTFTGAVTGSYDGSEPMSVNIPSGGGGSTDVALGMSGASVGQIAKITAVDDTGKPTAWEAVDFPSGGSGGGERLVADGTKIATGTIPSGAAAWSGGSFGVTIGDLKNWKKFRIVANLGSIACFHISLPNGKGYIFNNTAWTNQNHFYDLEWIDSDRTILGGYFIAGNAYNNPAAQTHIVTGDSNGDSFSPIAASIPLLFKTLDSSKDEMDVRYIINTAQSAEGTWSIFGILRYEEG